MIRITSKELSEIKYTDMRPEDIDKLEHIFFKAGYDFLAEVRLYVL